MYLFIYECMYFCGADVCKRVITLLYEPTQIQMQYKSIKKNKNLKTHIHIYMYALICKYVCIYVTYARSHSAALNIW